MSTLPRPAPSSAAATRRAGQKASRQNSSSRSREAGRDHHPLGENAMLHFASHQYPQMRMLSDDQIRDLHLAALEILERTGVAVQHERALDLLTRAGARVDGERVRIPGHLVDQAIRTAPERRIDTHDYRIAL